MSREADMDERRQLTDLEKSHIESIVNEALEEKLRDVPTKADLEELAKVEEIFAILRILEKHELIKRISG